MIRLYELKCQLNLIIEDQHKFKFCFKTTYFKRPNNVKIYANSLLTMTLLTILSGVKVVAIQT